jgi:peptide/nickel transport system permease protein
MSSEPIRPAASLDAPVSAVLVVDVTAAGSPVRRRPGASFFVGAAIVGLVALMAVVSFVWTPYDPTFVDAAARLRGVGDAAHVLGTDKLGRDVLSQILVGARTTLFVGIVAVGVAGVIGVPLGIVAAMAPRWLGETLMRGIDLLLAFPALLLAIMFTAVYGGSTLVAMVAIGIASVPSFVRLVRSGALQVLSTEYVLAARAAGRGPWAIGLRHVLPNVSGLVIVQASVSFAIAVLAEAALSFLGYGTPPPTPSWGRMLQESQELLFAAPRLAIIPGIAIALAVLGFNLLGDGLRDHYDPRLEDRR